MTTPAFEFNSTLTASAIGLSPSEPVNANGSTGFSFGPGYVLGFFGVLAILILLGVISAYRSWLIRRRRREMGLPEWGDDSVVPVFGGLYAAFDDPPAIHDVALMEGWIGTRPLSTMVMYNGMVDPPTPVIPPPPDFYDTDPRLWKHLKRMFLVSRRHVKPEEPPVQEKEKKEETVPTRVVMTVLIAMPRMHKGLSEKALPEVALGISEMDELWPRFHQDETPS